MSGANNNSDNGAHVINIFSLVIAAACSLGLMIIVGHGNKSLVLMSMFTLWVASPYVTLLVLNRKSIIPAKRLNYIILTISIASVIFYITGYLFPGKTPAFIFLLVPFISWLLIGTIIIISKKNK